MVAGGRAFFQMGHFDVAEIILRECVPFGVDIYLEQFSLLLTKDLGFQISGPGREIRILVDLILGKLFSPDLL